MAIPTWSYADRASCVPSSSTGSTDPERVGPSDFEDSLEVFSLFTDPTRVEVLTILYDSSQPLSYTALLDGVSIEDSGKFNYHLRQLGTLIDSSDGQYTLTERGRALTRELITTQRAAQRTTPE